MSNQNRQQVVPEFRDKPLPYKKPSCGDFFSDEDYDGHAVFNPECDICQEANSDAPDWTIR